MVAHSPEFCCKASSERRTRAAYAIAASPAVFPPTVRLHRFISEPTRPAGTPAGLPTTQQIHPRRRLHRFTTNATIRAPSDPAYPFRPFRGGQTCAWEARTFDAVCTPVPAGNKVFSRSAQRAGTCSRHVVRGDAYQGQRSILFSAVTQDRYTYGSRAISHTTIPGNLVLSHKGHTHDCRDAGNVLSFPLAARSPTTVPPSIFAFSAPGQE